MVLLVKGNVGQIWIYKSSDSNLYFVYQGQVVGVSASSWTAGSTYQITAKMGHENTLNGTNYLSISVNDDPYIWDFPCKFGLVTFLGGTYGGKLHPTPSSKALPYTVDLSLMVLME